MNPFVHTYYSNRAMALIKMFRFEQAEDDCTYVLERFPLTAAAAASAHAPAQDKGVGGSGLLGEKDRVKALLRRATARDALQKYDEAERDLKEVLRLEPGHRQAKEDLAMVRSQKAELDQARYNEAYASRLRGGGPPGGGAGAAAAAMMGGAGGGGVGVGLSPEERRLQMQVLSQMGLDPAAIEQMMAAEAAAGGGLGSY